MNLKTMIRTMTSYAGVVAILSHAPAWSSEAWPSRPITLLVGFAAGGPTDLSARVAAEGLSRELGQSVIVENKAGANGQIALMQLKRAKPDGYTIGLASSGPLSVSPARFKSLPYSVEDDFRFIGPVARYPYLLVAPVDSKADTLDSLVQIAKADPGKLNAASVSHTQELTLALFEKNFKIDVTPVHYKGDSAAVSDLVGGRLDFGFMSPSVAMPLVDSGKLKVLAVTDEGLVSADDRKYPVMENFDVRAWNGLIGPAGLPDSMVSRLAAALQKVLAGPELRSTLAASGQATMSMAPDEFQNYALKETQLWKEVAQQAGLEPQ